MEKIHLTKTPIKESFLHLVLIPDFKEKKITDAQDTT